MILQLWMFKNVRNLWWSKQFHNKSSGSYRKKRKEEAILSRLRIGHSRTTHSYFLEPKQQPTCHACQTKYTVKHILIECTDLVHIKETFYRANDMKELFQKIEMNNIISFLKAVNLYRKISRNFQLYQVSSINFNKIWSFLQVVPKKKTFYYKTIKLSTKPDSFYKPFLCQ